MLEKRHWAQYTFAKRKGLYFVLAPGRKNLPQSFSSLKQCSFGVYFDPLEIQRENIPAVGYLQNLKYLKGLCICMFGDCFGALDFTVTSKNNGIIIALTTTEKEGRKGDSP